MDKKYLPNLDFLRVVAAYFVMLYHFNWEGDDLVSSLFSYGYLGVYVFFCISGFISPLAMKWSGYRLKDWKSFLLSRFFRLYPAFAIIALLELFLYTNGSWMGYSYKFDQITWFQLVTNFTWTAELYKEDWLVPVFWTLAIEAQFIIAMLFIYPLLNHKNEWIRLLPIIVFTVTSYFVGRGDTLPSDFAWTGDTLLSYGVVFGMGMLVYLHYVKNIRPWVLVLLLALAFFSCARGVSMTWALTSMGTVVFLILMPNLPFRFIPYFGKFAYSFFLIHITFGGAAMFHLRFFPEEWYFQLIRVLIAGVVSFFAAWVFYYKIEKPFHAFARKIKSKS